jgi:c-di-GMP-binding flagellar brake protein YcgR
MADDDDKLGLKIGDNLQLQFVGDAKRHYGKVIGYLEPKSLLITTPRKAGKVMLVREGTVVDVRMMSGNSVYGFITNVIQTCLQPFPYLHLAYPKELQKSVVRKAQRAEVNLIVSVEKVVEEGETVASGSAAVNDISVSGALLIAGKVLGQVEDMLIVKARVDVGDVHEYINIPSVIRSVRERESEDTGKIEYLHGVEFQMENNQENIMLHGFVYERLLKQLTK